MTQPPSPPRRSGAAGTPGHVAGGRRGRTGGRVAGKEYAPQAPRLAGHGENRWPRRDYSQVQPRSRREAYIWWQQICKDVAPRRHARGWEQQHLADAARLSVNTVQRIERGEWVAAHNLFAVCSVLDLRIEQTVAIDVAAQNYGKGNDPDTDRRLARPAASDRIATWDEVRAGRVVIAALARHHNLLEPRLGPDGTVYVRSNESGFAPVWRFASVVAQTLGVWVNVSTSEKAAQHAEAEWL